MLQRTCDFSSGRFAVCCLVVSWCCTAESHENIPVLQAGIVFMVVSFHRSPAAWRLTCVLWCGRHQLKSGPSSNQRRSKPKLQPHLSPRNRRTRWRPQNEHNQRRQQNPSTQAAASRIENDLVALALRSTTWSLKKSCGLNNSRRSRQPLLQTQTQNECMLRTATISILSNNQFLSLNILKYSLAAIKPLPS